MRILLISSTGLDSSASLVEDYLTAIETGGNDVLFLTKYPCNTSRSNVLFIYDSFPEIKCAKSTVVGRIKSKIKKLFPFIVKYRELRRPQQRVVNTNEFHTPVPVEDIISRITGQHFDIMITLFLEGLMNMSTIASLSERLNIPVLVNSVDMALMTGGCYYPLGCRGYMSQCKECPASSEFASPKQPNINFLCKKEIFNKSKCFIAVNDWLFEQYVASGIIDESKLYTHNIVINDKMFRPVDVCSVRQRYGLPEDAFIMFAGASYLSEKRKGFKELCKSLDFFDHLREKKRNAMLILASREQFKTDDYLKVDFPVVIMPFLPTEQLADIYACSDLYLSPSLCDAGPSMINQSLMSGTPVISFDIGVAQTVIENEKTGIKCELADCKAFAEGINFFYNMPRLDYDVIRKHCRNVAMQVNSITSVSKEINAICKDIQHRIESNAYS